MKRTFIIRNIIIAIVIVAVVAGVIFYFLNNKDLDYEIEEVNTYNYFVLKQNNLSGVIDRNGNIIIEPKYDEVKIPNPEKPIFACYENSEVKMLNENKEEIYTKYETVEPIRLKDIASDLMYEKSILKYKKDEKYGLINLDGKKILDAKYDEIEGLPYKEGELVVKQGEKYGIINMNGKTLVNPKYDNVQVDAYYTEGEGYKYAGYIVSITTDEGYRYGYIDYRGKIILQPNYNSISRITDVEDKDELYLIISKNGQYGVLKNKDELIKNEYQSISYDETNKLLAIEKSKKYGVATLEGKIIVPEEYEQIDINGTNIYATSQEGTVVFNNKGEKTEIAANIVIQNTSNEKYKIKIKDENGTKYGVIGQNGEQKIEEKYNYIEYLYDNYFRVSDERAKLGVIDEEENVKIEIDNDLLQVIEETNVVQATKLNTQTISLYTKDMKKICEMANAKINVQNGIIKLYNNTEIKYFDKQGKELKAIEAYPQNTLFAKSENGKWGFVNKNEEFTIQAIYDEVTEFNEYGFAGIKKDDKWGVINLEGKEILEPTYELKTEMEPSFINKYYKVEYGLGEVYYTDYIPLEEV